MNVREFFSVFGIIVLGMLLIFLANGGATGTSQAAQGLANASGQFFSGFKQAV